MKHTEEQQEIAREALLSVQCALLRGDESDALKAILAAIERSHDEEMKQLIHDAEAASERIDKKQPPAAQPQRSEPKDVTGDTDIAIRTIRQREKREQPPSTDVKCRKCGYSLTSDQICTHCGAEVQPPATDDKQWTVVTRWENTPKCKSFVLDGSGNEILAAHRSLCEGICDANKAALAASEKSRDKFWAEQIVAPLTQQLTAERKKLADLHSEILNSGTANVIELREQLLAAQAAIAEASDIMESVHCRCEFDGGHEPTCPIVQAHDWRQNNRNLSALDKHDAEVREKLEIRIKSLENLIAELPSNDAFAAEVAKRKPLVDALEEIRDYCSGRTVSQCRIIASDALAKSRNPEPKEEK